MSITSPEVAGLLYKKRGGFGKMMPNAWQYRFVAITKEGYLLYFDTENADADFDISKARGRLDLKSIQYDYSIDAIEGAPTNYSIQIGIPNEEKWKLCADSKEIQSKWCKVLDKFMSEKVVMKPAKIVVSDDEQDKLKKPLSAPNSPNAANIVETSNQNEIVVSETPTISNSSNIESGTTGQVTQSTIDTIVHPVSVESQPKSSATSAAAGKPAAAVLPKAHHSKKRLKLAAKKDFIEQEWIEWSLAILVLNLSMLGVMTAQRFILKLLYILACNAVVGYTLLLRHLRSQKVIIPAKTDPIPTTTIATTSVVVSKIIPTDSSECPNIETPSAVSVPEIVSGEIEPEATETPLNQKPLPGFTYVQSKIDPKLSPPHTWSIADHRQFTVRVGPDYNRYKKKAASGSPIYEPFAVDVFCAKQRVDHCSTRFQLPDTSDIDTHHPHVPPIFVIQIQIPSEPPTSFFSSSEDGPGWAVVMYFKISEDACNQLKDLSTASPAVKLFAEWCEKAPVDPAWRGRFKVINSCTNMEELGFPSMIVSYNAKPVLIRRTGTIFKGPNYMEMNIHVHKFANVAKQSIYLISSRCALMFMQIGFVIEGREDKELPETLFACVAVNRPQEDQAEFIFDE